jgi:2-deoxy-scyllo-inosamine dehydrogenase (SAM-dependent)
MPDAVFDTLVSELARLRFVGRFSHHFLNEPLLRKDLEDLVARVHRAVPGAFQVLFTNGDFLTESRYTSLLAAGIAEIVLTSHSGRSHPERAKQHVQFPEEMTLSNRGGYLTKLPRTTAAQQRTPCFAPSEMLIVAANGDVLLCHEDANRRHVMGNVLHDPLDVIWDNPEFRRFRRLLREGRRIEAAGICSECTNFDFPTPGRAMSLWLPEKERPR